MMCISEILSNYRIHENQSTSIDTASTFQVIESLLLFNIIKTINQTTLLKMEGPSSVDQFIGTILL